MATPYVPPVADPLSREESSRVAFLRFVRRTFLPLAVVALAVTVLFLGLKWPAAVVPGVVALGAYAIFALAAALEHAAGYDGRVPPVEVGVGTSPVDATGREAIVTGRYIEREEPSDPDPVAVRHAARERHFEAGVIRGSERLALLITGILIAIAILLAALLFGGELLIIGAIGLFLYMALLGLPYWLAAAHEREEEARLHRR